jgi:hypothetical protein
MRMFELSANLLVTVPEWHEGTTLNHKTPPPLHRFQRLWQTFAAAKRREPCMTVHEIIRVYRTYSQSIQYTYVYIHTYIYILMSPTTQRI